MEKRAKLDIAQNLFSGLDDERDRNWIEAMKRQYNKCMMEGVINYPVVPVVKNKRVRIEANIYQSSLFVVLERRAGNAEVGIKLTPAQFEQLKAKYNMLRTFIKSVQSSDPSKMFGSMGLEIKKDYDGWKYCRVEIGEEIMLTLKWEEQKRQSMVKIHKGMMTEGGYWAADKENEICLSAGGMMYFMDYLSEMISENLEAWSTVVQNNMLYSSPFVIDDDDDDEEALFDN